MSIATSSDVGESHTVDPWVTADGMNVDLDANENSCPDRTINMSNMAPGQNVFAYSSTASSLIFTGLNAMQLNLTNCTMLKTLFIENCQINSLRIGGTVTKWFVHDDSRLDEYEIV